MKKKTVIIAVAVLLALAGIVTSILLLTKSKSTDGEMSEKSDARTVVDSFMKALVDGDAKKMSKLIVPEYDNYCKEFNESAESSLKDICMSFSDYFGDCKYEVSSAEKLDVDEDLKSMLDDFDISYKSVSEGADVNVTVTYSKGGEKKTETIYFTVIKENGQWYVLDFE